MLEYLYRTNGERGDKMSAKQESIDFCQTNLILSDMTFEEAFAQAGEFYFPEEVLNGTRKIQVISAEKDYENQCIKLEISY